ncbi:MAG TPA: NUDIX domain-containing protein [Candidatus Thermoplasmatota archaeon]|nr:NUDIX domain-containing protein [Candidatus Thermoplasmatota archaeon]
MKKTEEKVHKLIQHFSTKLPHFKDGRINYTTSDTAPVITVFIAYKNTFLLLKRSQKVSTYKGKWNTVAGYLDNPNQTILEKILEELSEEIDINKEQISSYSFGKQYQFTDENNKKTWIVLPTLVILLEKPEINLNWEHTEYKWITMDEIQDFDTVPNLKKSMKRALKPAHNE